MTPYEQFRRLIRDLNLSAQRDLEAVWGLTGGDPKALEEALAEIVQTYGDASAAVAADWYDELRADVGVARGFTAHIPEPENPGTRSLVGWAAKTANDEHSFRTLIEGGIQRRITNYSRDVVMTSSIRDPRARGWMRTGSGECGFCAMLIARGATYTKASADFASHDNCECGCAPAFAPDQIKAVKAEFVPSARRRSAETKDKDAERARQWIAENL